VGFPARLGVTAVLCAVSFAACVAALKLSMHMDVGLALGWATLPLTIVAGVLCPWAWEGRKPKEALVTAKSAAGQLAGKVILNSSGRLLSPVINLLSPIINVIASRPAQRAAPADYAGHHEACETTWPGRSLVVGNVPGEPKAFQPRHALRAKLGQESALVHVLTGPTGAGKTHVAAAYAREQISAGWRLVAWVDATDTRLMVAGLATVAVRLGLVGPGERAENAARRLRSELESNGARCLLVFDNVTDVDQLRQFLPAAGQSQVLVTSTRKAAAGLGDLVPVNEFTMAEAMGFLRQWTERSDAAGSRALADELGRLPLGLVQAAALMAKQNLDYDTYLERLRTLPVGEYLVHVEGDEYPTGVADAIWLSLQGIEAGSGAGVCGTVIDLLSVLSPSGVSRNMLRFAALSGAVPGLGHGPWAAAGWDAAVGRVADASLLAFSMNDSLIAHPLVMRVVRERQVAAGTLSRVAATAVDVLFSTAGRIERPWEDRLAIRELAGHIAALTEHVSPSLRSFDSATTADLLRLRGRVISLLNDLGDRFGQVIPLSQALVTDCGRYLGGDHRHTLDTRNSLAVAYLAAGFTDKAVLLLEDIVPQRRRVLGSDHPDTLSSRNTLARACLTAGRLDEACLRLEEVADQRRDVLGKSHPDTLTSRNDLGLTYRKLNRLDEAVALLKRTLAEREKVLVADDPGIFTSRASLALAYQSKRRHDDAIALHERTLKDRERVLGTDHIDTLWSRHFLADAYYLDGQLHEAIPIFAQALAHARRVLGDDHPLTKSIHDRAAAAGREAKRAEQS
jgi:tetratricopeptide (TPR) repeat protein